MEAATFFLGGLEALKDEAVRQIRKTREALRRPVGGEAALEWIDGERGLLDVQGIALERRRGDGRWGWKRR